MRCLKILIGGFFIVLVCLSATWANAQVPGRLPSLAFDSVNNRYLMVWEENEGDGYQIKGKFLNSDGTDAGTAQVLSPNRTQQGCFYQDFDSDNGPVTTPTNCPNNRKPSVAYNDGQYLITWEVSGSAASPQTAPDNQYAVIFARILNATDLSPLPGWEEGILISKIYIAADRPGGCGSSGSYLCNDSQIQAWSQSRNPHVAGRLTGTGFVVTWETNIDFIDCYSADRRGGWSVYGRYIDEGFSATSDSNPPLFAIFRDDSTIDEKCSTLDNVDNATNPRIAFNSTSGDFVAVYKVGRANGGRTSIGAKRITVDTAGTGSAPASMMPDYVASLDSVSLTNPELIAFKGDYFLFVDDGSAIYSKRFTSNGIANSTPLPVNLGAGTNTNARAATNLGQGGQGPTLNTAPERILLTYTQSGNIFAALLDEALTVQGSVENVSTGIATANQSSVAGSDQANFLIAWQGDSNGDMVFVKEIATVIVVDPTPTPDPPTAPILDAEPADNATWAPTRLYLSWQAATDPDPGDSVTYNVYFVTGTTIANTASPYASGLTDTHFIIQASTDDRPEYEPDAGITPIFLAASTNYAWKVCAKDTQGHESCSAVRQFHTDDSVVGWWRFDENPAGSVCAGGGAGETVCDYSGNNNHGVPTNSPTWLTPPMPEILGGAIDFNGVDEFINVPHFGDLTFSNGESLGIEIRLSAPAFTSDPFDPFILSKGSGSGTNGHGNYSVIIRTSDSKLRFSYTNQLDSTKLPTYDGAAAVPTSAWSHIILTNTFGAGGTMKLFIDGVQSGGIWVDATGAQTATGNEPPAVNSNPLTIGRRSLDPQNHYNGMIDELIIYRSLLTSQFVNNANQATFP